MTQSEEVLIREYADWSKRSAEIDAAVDAFADSLEELRPVIGERCPDLLA